MCAGMIRMNRKPVIQRFCRAGGAIERSASYGRSPRNPGYGSARK